MAAPHQTKEYSIIHHDDYEIKYIFENFFSLILLIIGILPYDAKIIDIYFQKAPALKVTKANHW